MGEGGGWGGGGRGVVATRPNLSECLRMLYIYFQLESRKLKSNEIMLLYVGQAKKSRADDLLVRTSEIYWRELQCFVQYIFSRLL